MRCFEVMSGLKINYHKSAVCGVGFQVDEIEGLAHRLNCLSKRLPFNFLGLPLGANPRRKSTWNPILDKVSKRLSSWKRKLLSFAGRLTLIKSVLSNLPLYFLSLFKMPIGVNKALRKIQAKFLWGGSKDGRSVHLVNWGEVTKNKNQGGLGVRDLGEVNDCMLLKWWWRFGAEDKALWKSVVCSRYGRVGGGWLPSLHNIDGASTIWKDIVQIFSLNQSLGGFYNQNFRLAVGNGRRIQFWLDTWMNGRGLKEEFPRLYSLSTEKEESLQQISVKKSLGVWQLQFRRRLLAWEEEELQRLYAALESSPVLREEVEDSCSWLISKSGKFSVSSLWNWWVVNRGPVLEVPAGVWASLAPPKMRFICWLAWRGRIKTCSFLRRIGVLPPNAQIQCVFCQSGEESMEHVLLFCPQVRQCWAAMASWWDQNLVIPGTVEGLLHWWSGGIAKSWSDRAWQAVPALVLWSVWKTRNKCLFKGETPDFAGLCDWMKLQIALWVKWCFKVDYSVHNIVSNLYQIRLLV
ncbi:unnamed protein product [Camellia sinensis]